MYAYKHKKTGTVITTHGKVTGENWEQVKTQTKKGGNKPKEPPKQDEDDKE